MDLDDYINKVASECYLFQFERRSAIITDENGAPTIAPEPITKPSPTKPEPIVKPDENPWVWPFPNTEPTPKGIFF